MGLALKVVALLAFSNIALVSAQSSRYGSCVASCITANPKSSFCDGNETGTALDQCRCASFSGPSEPLITCISACPEDQQLPYAQNLPALCNKTLFPNLDLSSSSSASSSSTQTATSSGSGSGATTTAASSAAASATSANGGVQVGASVRTLFPLAAGIVALNFVWELNDASPMNS